MSINNCKSILLLAVLLWLIIPVKAQTDDFQVINGVPHLPVFNNTGAVSSPLPGAMIFSTENNGVQVYSGRYWDNFCTLFLPETADTVAYFRVVDGIPCLPVQPELSGPAYPGSIYYPSNSPGVHINNGSNWYSAYDLPHAGDIIDNTQTKMGDIVGIDGGIAIPVLISPPSGVIAGAVYIDVTTKQLQVYNGTSWVSSGCEVCAPYATAVFIDGDVDNMNFGGAYGYFQKDGYEESGSLFRWFMADDDSGTNKEEVGTDATWSDYDTSLDGKYIQFEVSPVSSQGQIGPAAQSDWYLLANCPPMAGGLMVVADTWEYSQDVNFKAAYTYYDKNKNAEGESIIIWYRSDNELGTNKDSIGTGASWTYRYTNADQGYYINYSLVPIAVAGKLDGEMLESDYHQIYNCAPQLDGVYVNNNWGLDGNIYAGFTYFDKEGDEFDSATYQWYNAISSSGDGEQAVGEGTDSYMVKNDEGGLWFRVEVTPYASTGYTDGETYSSEYIQLGNCPPQVSGLLVEADTWEYSDEVNFSAGYIYYDKEKDQEEASSIVWYLSDDEFGTNKDTIAYGANLNFNYNNDVQDKYISFGVTPIAASGYTTGVEVESDYYQIYNCPPQLSGVVVNNNWSIDGNLYAGYSYFDKEREVLDSITYQWYTASDNLGTDETAVGNNSKTYTPGNDENGLWFRVELTPYATYGYTEGDTYSSEYIQLDNCVPQADGLVASADTWEYSADVNFTAGYIYYDRDADAEGETIVRWYISDDEAGTNKDSIGSGANWIYTYEDADQDRFISFGVEPIASTGNTTGEEVESGHYRVYNCAPQLDGVYVNNNWGIDSKLYAGFTYFDKEGDAFASATYQWYKASDALGTDEVAVGENIDTYVPGDNENTLWFRVEVTPHAAAGYSVGDTYSSEFIQIENCAPQAGGLLVSASTWVFSDNIDFKAGYIYYDKEEDEEKASDITWYTADDEFGTNKDSIGTGITYTYTYQNTDQGKYIGFGVTPKALSGNATGVEVESDYFQIYNCPPQLSGVIVNNNWSIDGNLYAGYSFFDYEEELLESINYQWYVASDNSGSDETAVGDNSKIYTPGDDENGLWFRVKITPYAEYGYTEGDSYFSEYIQLDNCVPQADGLVASADTWEYSADVNFTAGYIYYDRDADAEGETIVSWYISDDEAGTNKDTIGSGANWIYTFTDADQGRFISFGVEPIASTGNTTGEEVESGHYRVYNCAPQLDGVYVNNNWGIDSKLYAGFTYFDKEGDAFASATYQWYKASDALGTDEVAVGDGTDTYVPGDNENTLWFRVEVTPHAAAGYSVGDTYSSEFIQIENCAPQVSGLIASADTWGYSEDVNFKAGYIFYDKEEDIEGESTVTWYRSDDELGTNKDTIGSGTDWMYTYNSSDQDKYISFSVVPLAVSGNSKGDAVESDYYQIFNCPPQLGGVIVNNNWSIDGKLYASYSYFDKEEDEFDHVEYQWYVATDGDGTDDTPVENNTNTFTPDNDQNGLWFRVEITPYAQSGYTAGVTYTSVYTQINNCAPQASGLIAASDNWEYSGGNSNFYAGYIYYDKERDAEGKSIVTWYISDDELGTNRSIVGSGTNHTYTYKNEDQGKYISFSVLPVALTGKTVGDTVRSGYYLINNCAPQLDGIYANNNWGIDGNLYASFAYYDKEGDELASISYQWYTATDESGTERTAVGDGTDTFEPTGEYNYLWFQVEITVFAATGYTEGATYISDYIQLGNCVPQVSALAAVADTWDYSSNVNFNASYVYYDKEEDEEDATVVTWYISEDEQGTGKDTVSSDDSWTYTYTNSDQGKYISFGVRPISKSGNAYGVETESEYYQIYNCEPQLGGVVVNNNWGIDGNLYAGYAYFDKEKDALDHVDYQWYSATNNSGADKTPVGDDSKVYTPTNDENGLWFSVEITPYAETGYTDGVTYASEYILLDNCVPQASALIAEANTWEYSDDVNFTAGYTYYDRDADPEGETNITWYISDDELGTNKDSIGEGANWTYTYEDAHQNKFISFGVQPVSLKGNTMGTEVLSDYYEIYNCPPQLDGVYVNNNWGVDGLIYAGFTYFDRENDAFGSATYQWYVAINDSGDGEVPVGNGSDTHKPTDDENGMWFRVEVTPYAATGYTIGATYSSEYLQLENCVPQVSGLILEADTWGYSEDVNFKAGYVYYDKEEDEEGESNITWYMSDDELGTNSEVVGSGANWTYTYKFEDQDRYISYAVEPVAATGNGVGYEVHSEYYHVYNCQPQVSGVVINNNWVQDGYFHAGFAYFDKEGDELDNATYQWYSATDKNGTDKTQLGVGTQNFMPDNSQNGLWIMVEITPHATAGNKDGDTYSSEYVYLDNCIPQASGMIAEADTWEYSDEVNFTAGYVYYDRDGDVEGSSEVIWYIADDEAGTNIAPIGTGVNWTYSFSDDDNDKYLIFGVQPISLYGNSMGEETKSGYYLIHNDAPVASNAEFTPTSANFSTSDIFTASIDYSDTEGDANGKNIYTWYMTDDAAGTVGKVELYSNNNTPSYTYIYSDDDQDKYLSVGVTPVATAGYTTGTEVMSATLLIHNNPPVISDLIIKGQVENGQKLRVEYTYTDTEGDTEGTPLYQWYRDNESTPIEGATESTYLLTVEDIGHYIGVVVTPKAINGYTTGSDVSVTTTTTVTN